MNKLLLFISSYFKTYPYDNSVLNQYQYSSRLILLIFIFVLLYSYIAIKIILLAIPHYSSKAISSYTGKHIKTWRNDIFDRNMNMLASNLPITSLFVHPYKIQNKELFVQELSKVIKNLDSKQLLQNLYSNKSFIWIKRNITPRLQQKIYNLGLPGIELKDELIRTYPHGNLLSHVLGYTDIDNNGIAGIEKYFNESISTPQQEPIQLSIDLNIQNIVHEELTQAIAEFHATGGIGIVADPNNGEILALVSKPDFNPNQIPPLNSPSLFNQNSLGLYELGSVFKAITVSIALDTAKTSLNDLYYLQNFKISNLTVKDLYKMEEGWYSVGEIFLKSSNRGIAQIASELNPTITSEYYSKFGFYSSLPIELPEKSTPVPLPKEKWTKLSLVTMSYGYQLAITPLHFVQAIISIVNGGFFCPITLIKQGLNPSINTSININNKSPFQNLGQNVHARCNQILNKTTSEQMNKLLYGVTHKGTGKKADVNGYLVGGKTGTAEKVVKGKYSKTKRRSSFISAFPMINPKYVIYILLDEPQGNSSTFYFATAGYTVAPAVSKIIQRIVALQGIPPYDEKQTGPALEVPMMHLGNR